MTPDTTPDLPLASVGIRQSASDILTDTMVRVIVVHHYHNSARSGTAKTRKTPVPGKKYQCACATELGLRCTKKKRGSFRCDLHKGYPIEFVVHP